MAERLERLEALAATITACPTPPADVSSGDAIAKSESQQPPQRTGTSSSCTASLHGGCDPEMGLRLPANLAATQRDQIDGVACEMPGVHGPAGAAGNQRGLALTRAQACRTRKS